jgi:D-serine dehydratase
VKGAPSRTVDPLDKGLGWLTEKIAPEAAAQRGWNLLREDLALPAAVLYQDKLRNNLDWMQRFVAAYGAHLAPHGKTTMAPRLFAMQLEAGAWGITLATAQQVHVAYAHGVRRVLMANQLVGRANMDIISNLISDPAFEFYCLVDSAAQIEQLRAYFSARGQRLNVLLEVGVADGRAGVRDAAQLEAVLQAIANCSGSLVLSGIELFEGVLKQEEEIRAFVARAVEIAREIVERSLFGRTPFLLSGAGSAWYDVVAEIFSAAHLQDAAEMVLRPGCYLTHDIGAYREAQARIAVSNPVARQMGDGLVPALHVWAYVQSIPEAGRAIVGMGKRDAAFDAGLPVPALHFRPGDATPKPSPVHWTLTKMMDQHAYLHIAPGDDLCVGDMIAFNIAHPCLTFDKWRVMALVNTHFDVLDLIQTYF